MLETVKSSCWKSKSLRQLATPWSPNSMPAEQTKELQCPNYNPQFVGKMVNPLSSYFCCGFFKVFFQCLGALIVSLMCWSKDEARGFFCDWHLSDSENCCQLTTFQRLPSLSSLLSQDIHLDSLFVAAAVPGTFSPLIKLLASRPSQEANCQLPNDVANETVTVFPASTRLLAPGSLVPSRTTSPGPAPPVILPMSLCRYPMSTANGEQADTLCD